MDPTLTAILTALYQAHATIDTLNRRVAELEEAGQRQVADFRERLESLETERIPAGWRLVKES